MTVGELKKFIEKLPDGMRIAIQQDDDAGFRYLDLDVIIHISTEEDCETYLVIDWDRS